MATFCEGPVMSSSVQALPTSPTKRLPVRRGDTVQPALRPKLVPPKPEDAVIACEDNLTFMRSLPAESINLIVTSPPYNLGKEYETKGSLDAYLESQKLTIAEAVRVLNPSGSLCWQIGNYVDEGEVYPLDILLYPIFKRAGLQLRNRIIWTFGHGLH